MREEEYIKKLKIKGWNFSHEREFAENLFVGRFNYFLVAYSLFMTAGFANNFIDYKYGVFYVGFLILLACWIPLYRAFLKHDKIIAIIFNHKKNHPAAVVEDLMRQSGYRKFFVASNWMR